jgi:predicted DNA-binding transcriptional regulator AlpA
MTITLTSQELEPLIHIKTILAHLQTTRRYFRENYEADFPKPKLAPSREVALYSKTEYEKWLEKKAAKFEH